MSSASSIALRHYAAYNARDLHAYTANLDAQIEVNVDGTLLVGPAAVAAFTAASWNALPDMRLSTPRFLAETQDTVMVSFHIESTAQGSDGDTSHPDAGWQVAGVTHQVIQVRDGLITSITSSYTPHPADRPGVYAMPSRTEAGVILREHAALRRVAELAAGEVDIQEIFDAVVSEASGLLGDAPVALMRYEPPGMARVVAGCRSLAPVGLVVQAGDTALHEVLKTARAARNSTFEGTVLEQVARELGVVAGVAVPVLVDGQVWGNLSTHTSEGEPPPHTEERLAQFAELAAVAISGADARQALQTVVEEQSALRRVAELVARGDDPTEVFTAVAAEASGVLGGEPMTLTRFASDSELDVVASCGGPTPVGTRIAFAPATLPELVLHGGRPVRVDDYRDEDDAELAEHYGMAAAVAVPVSVEGRVWGLLTATSSTRPLPPGTEQRLQQFADLVGFAIANAEKTALLAASRARVVATADETRRRLQRDVHDGAQQQLVQTVITLRLAGEAFASDDAAGAAAYAAEALGHAERAATGLREIVRGILPASLTRGGLRAGVESIVNDLSLPVAVDVHVPRLAPEIETTAYFLVAEALTNVVKHARATHANVRAWVSDGTLEVEVDDDGTGGARAGDGSGLTGLFDRVEARGGTISILSPAGVGTTVRMVLPLDVALSSAT